MPLPGVPLPLAVAAGLALGPAPPGGTPPTLPGEGVSEAVGDLILECRGAGPVGEGPAQPGPPAMDLIDAAVWFEDEVLHTSAETAGDPGAWFAQQPESSAFVFRILVRQAGTDHLLELIDEWHQGAAHLGAELDGHPVDWPVTREYDGAFVRHRVEVPPDYASAEPVAFDLTANVIAAPGDGYLCDRFGQDDTGQPAAPVGTTTTVAPTAAATTTTAAPPTVAATGTPTTTTSTAPAAREQADDGAGRDDEDGGGGSGPGVFWWVPVVLGFLALLWWWFRGRRPPWLPGGGSHGAPVTPPPEQNDFGE